MAGNTTTKKQYNNVSMSATEKALPSKTVSYSNRGGMYEGQLKTGVGNEKFADPHNDVTPGIGGGISKLYDDIGERSGFITDGYLDKGNTPYGEDAKFNYLPPGMDISNQEMAEIHDMPLRKLVAESYPGDGWMPAPRDITE